MKVLHINCNYLTTVLHQTMIEKLNETGVISDVFAPTFDESMKVIEPNSNVYVAECFNKWDRLFFDYKQSKILNAVDKHYMVEQYDCIHAYTLFTDGNTAMCLSKKYNRPYVVAVRDTDVNTFFKYMPHLRSRGVKIMKNAARVFFLSETYKEHVLETYVSKEDYKEIYAKSMVIPNGIDDFWLENIHEDKDIEATLLRLKNSRELHIVCVAQIIKRKNIPVIQKAIDILNENGWKATLDVIGKGVDLKLLEEIKAHQYTTYHEPVAKDELINYYRTADIFVLLSKHETFGLVYAEAMTQGLPVIYTKGQGFDGQFREGTVGFAVGHQDIENIVVLIEKIVIEYRKFVENSIDNVKKFRWKDICFGYQKIYQMITKEN